MAMSYIGRLTQLSSLSPLQTYLSAKTEKLKNQQREYEAQLQYRQHLQVNSSEPYELIITGACLRLQLNCRDDVVLLISEFSDNHEF